ncbi:Wadjet anti-phage system protein JetD domain-containing protein [Paenibacillus sp. B01]|uniref:Wadjet anti-phage system protein JetD domain-containing protein n=1 Tax=Paenibacillus sp. B01 TaxID=2660554 RepID=UPI0018910C09|nr:Wadjet anti-phage system protein JetD domain-containing protein [Paenibacillus sp. B01]
MNLLEQIHDVVTSKQSAKTKARLNVIRLESDIRSRVADYYEQGGYTAFAAAIKTLEAQGAIQPFKGSAVNGRTPALPLQYWVLPRNIEPSWDSLQIMKLSDHLQFGFYRRYPEWQTSDEWHRIESVHAFLQSAEERQWVSVEERSLELFGHEKYLSEPEGSQFLSRLGIDHSALKAKRWGEPFVMWLRPGTSPHEIREVLIVENLSFFHTVVMLQRRGCLNLSDQPDIIIYGEGKKIERSFSFFYELFPVDRSYSFRYVGDMDPEGYGILYRLHYGYPEAGVLPAAEIYEAMAQFHQHTVSCETQTKDERYLAFMLQHVTPDSRAASSMRACWAMNKRIPQEVLTVETWRKGTVG